MNSAVMLRKASRFTRQVLPAPVHRTISRFVPGHVRASNKSMRGDVTIMSFPKSGRTWLRIMIGRALQQHFGTELDESVIELHRLAEHDSRIPRIYMIHDGVDDNWRDPKQFRNRPLILLVRDPRT